MKNWKSEVKVIINENRFIFDHNRFQNKEPYFDNLEKPENGIFIESIFIKDEKLSIRGWSFGEKLEINKIDTSRTIIRREQRPDVKKSFSFIEEENSGFSITVNLKNENVSFQISLGRLNLSIVREKKDNKKPIKSEKNYIPQKEKEDLIIVGGAPSVRDHINQIKNFDGEVWALNDSVFWLEDNKLRADKLLAADQRFIQKNINRLKEIKCKNFIFADYIKLKEEHVKEKSVHRVSIIGRDGISDNLGLAFHGCTIAHLALQYARLLSFKNISITGVILDFPVSYERIDGSNTMPEFVHNIQIRNIKNIIQMMRKEDFNIVALEKNSNINFF